MVQTYTLRIKNGTRHVKQYRIWLWWKKYTCIKRANGRVYYEKKNVPGGKKIICSVLAEEKDSLLKPCRRNIREVTVTAVSFCLSSFRNWEIPMCILWQKKPKDKITIDHIFPVHCMEKYPAVRKRAALFGIHGSNDMKNLCTACMRCNQKKEAKMGIWILKGFLGKQPWYWPLRRILTVILVFFVLYLGRKIYMPVVCNWINTLQK